MAREANHEVPVNIDKEPLKSPTTTTGHALYVLGKVKVGYELFREVRGKGDDEEIADDDTPVHVKEGDHFYSAQKTLNPGT